MKYMKNRVTKRKSTMFLVNKIFNRVKSEQSGIINDSDSLNKSPYFPLAPPLDKFNLQENSK